MDPSAAIDTHTHFYDPSRPQGVPWPRPDEKTLFRQVLPRHWKALAAPAGILRTVVVEASGLLADNDWVLDLAAGEPCIAGFVGHVDPGDSFDAELARLAARPLFRGVRFGGAQFAEGQRDRTLRAMEALASRGLCLDLLVRPAEVGAAATLASRVPELRVIVDHLGCPKIDGGSPGAEWLDAMSRAAALPNVACKVSGYVEAADRRPGPTEAGFYRPVLEAALRLFGTERLIWGSNWPVCELGGSFEAVVSVARAFARAGGPGLERLLFTDNATRWYGIGAP